MTTATYDDITYNESERTHHVSELHPRGAVKAICVDCIDLGMQENVFKKGPDGQPLMQRRVRLVWETAKKKSDGRNFTVSKSYSMSLYDGSNGGNQAALYTHLASWLGASWDGQFRSKQLVGRTAELFIAHEKLSQDKTKTFAKVLAVNPLEDGETLEASGEYKRFVAKAGATAEDDDPTPF